MDINILLDTVLANPVLAIAEKYLPPNMADGDICF